MSRVPERHTCPSCDADLRAIVEDERSDPEYWCDACNRYWGDQWLTPEGHVRYKRWLAAGGWRGGKKAAAELKK